MGESTGTFSLLDALRTELGEHRFRRWHLDANTFSGHTIDTRVDPEAVNAQLYIALNQNGERVMLKQYKTIVVDPDNWRPAALRMLTEVKAYDAMQDAGILRFDGFFVEPDRNGERGVTVFEYMEQPTLRELIDAGTYATEADARQALLTLGGTLTRLNKQAGTVFRHRDIKPANVFSLGADGRTPFLLGDLADATFTERTGLGTQIGSILYTPPEQLYFGETNATTDGFMLGRTIIEWGIGAQKLKQLVAGQQRLASVAHAAYSPAFIAVLDKLTAPKREDRYHSLHDALRALDTRPIVAFTTPARPEASNGVHRARTTTQLGMFAQDRTPAERVLHEMEPQQSKLNVHEAYLRGQFTLTTHQRTGLTESDVDSRAVMRETLWNYVLDRGLATNQVIREVAKGTRLTDITEAITNLKPDEEYRGHHRDFWHQELNAVLGDGLPRHIYPSLPAFALGVSIPVATIKVLQYLQVPPVMNMVTSTAVGLWTAFAVTSARKRTLAADQVRGLRARASELELVLDQPPAWAVNAIRTQQPLIDRLDDCYHRSADGEVTFDAAEARAILYDMQYTDNTFVQKLREGKPVLDTFYSLPSPNHLRLWTKKGKDAEKKATKDFAQVFGEERSRAHLTVYESRVEQLKAAASLGLGAVALTANSAAVALFFPFVLKASYHGIRAYLKSKISPAEWTVEIASAFARVGAQKNSQFTALRESWNAIEHVAYMAKLANEYQAPPKAVYGGGHSIL